MTSEPGMVWTLLESFALSNNYKYQRKPLSKDFPVNERNFNWSDYRLSLSVMQHIQSHATHWRATCNYEKDGLIKTDFIQGSIQVFDVLKNHDNACFRVDYANVRDISCTDCTINMRQYFHRHVNVDSYLGTRDGCDLQLNTATSKVIDGNYCENFGYYNHINPRHRCSADSSATTQWWIGAIAS
ncbi:uncharacterized protein LOC110247943 [Exaiptasia diaphana]|uniref:Uncharacterized protein n=1 Tax=Exaiptasia diaphana TaxID=2652724 RepID=A0A913XTL6_EXADI|nr:uncharacterized protein LOC110247943 [Exaiptasia diaphana]